MSNFDVERKRGQHGRQGQSYRWFKAMPSPLINPTTGSARPAGSALPVNDNRNRNNNRIYVEQTIPTYVTYNGRRIAACRKALVHDTQTELQHPEFGLIRVGFCRFSVLPDEANPAKYDRIVLSQRRLVGRQNVIRDKGTTGTLLDKLNHAFLVSIESIADEETTYTEGTDYQLTANSDATNPFAPDSVQWLAGGSRPEVGATYCIEYQFNPLYEHLDDNVNISPPDKNGRRMPQRMTLTLIQSNT